MSLGADVSSISRAELFELLAQVARGALNEGALARVSVVTPNQRLAAALRQAFDSAQQKAGLVSWETADILPLAAFVERLYEDALYSELATGLPILLTDAQELSLWEDVVRGSQAGASLLSVPGAAALAREAWQLAHAWRLLAGLKNYPANDDARAFADWAWRYEGLTRRERHCERARLSDVVTPLLSSAALRKPATLVAYGFDMLTAQQRDLFAALKKNGTRLLACGPATRESVAHRVALASAKEEIRAAARWARFRLEACPDARIGIVVPNLAQSRNAVRRELAQVMEPSHALAGAESRTLPFNLSLGEPLSSQALVASALIVLKLAKSAVSGEVQFAEASRLIRSAFIAGSEAEPTNRARLDAELRRVAGPTINLERLRRAIARLTDTRSRYSIPACPVLSQRLGELSHFARENLSGAKRAAEWGVAISALLDAVGFPGARALDSVEFQTLKKFHEAIAGFAALDRVAARMRFPEACARLARIAADTVFQPEAPDVPIQVLGVLESAGLEFDHLWVMGLTDEAWPVPARPNPFIPVALQRAAGVPQSSAAASFDLDARITRGWLTCAGEVVLSYPLREDDRELSPSPLLRGLAEARVVTADEALLFAGMSASGGGGDALVLPEYQGLREAIWRACGEERDADFHAPPIAPSAESPGGTGIFRDQAACPFRSFARHRLGAEGLDAPTPGLDASERGTLLHAMLARVWQELKSSERLDACPAEELDALLDLAADHAIARLRKFRPDAIEGRFAAIEKARLVKLGRVWLEIERERPPFEVAAIEQKRSVTFGGLTVNARLDRMDRFTGAVGGGYAIIDYKTGNANVGDWLGERPDDPQLPLYAVSGAEAIDAVAFARLKAGEAGFKGVARESGLIPNVGTIDRQRSSAAKQVGSWEQLLEAWRTALDELGREFASGEACVRPKRGAATCRNCGLGPLCRISERSPVSLDGSEAAEEGTE